ncbi:MAG TPA: HEAT repeat domain-containing protein, partial [Bacteroidetes bacterium]|nr:HEAT repeat domain-containing protein [Bacteroidota bacterium]
MNAMTAQEIIHQIVTYGREGRSHIATFPLEEISQPLAEALVTAPEPLTRRIICNIMATQRHPSFFPALLQTLDDPDQEVINAAADAIGNISTAFPPAPPLQTILGQKLLKMIQATPSQNPNLGALLYGIGLLKYKPAATPIAQLLSSETPMVRWNAAEAIAHIADPTLLPSLIKQLKIEQHPRTKRIIE